MDGVIEEDAEETEEIRTEIYLSSNSEESNSSGNGNGSDDSSRHKSTKSPDQRRESKNAAGNKLGGNNASPVKPGGFRLGISVGATTIDMAEKYKKKDLELQ